MRWRKGGPDLSASARRGMCANGATGFQRVRCGGVANCFDAFGGLWSFFRISCLASAIFHDPMVLWRTPDAKSGQDSEAIAVVFAPESFMERWLPHGERDTMHRFMRTLGDERGPPPFILNRIRRDLPMIQEVFRDYGLPPELAFLPAVESSFRPWAMSPAGAAGLWQLMPGTAQRFGLTISENEDQRFDKRQSTVAAAAYLAELYRLFVTGLWLLLRTIAERGPWRGRWYARVPSRFQTSLPRVAGTENSLACCPARRSIMSPGLLAQSKSCRP